MKTRLKIYITLASILCWVNFSCTEDAIVKETSSLRSSSLLSAEVVTIKLEQAGTLAEKIGDKKNTVENLVLSGPFNAVDLICMRSMPYLKVLDMRDVSIQSGGGTYSVSLNWWGQNLSLSDNIVGPCMFFELRKLESVILPKSITDIDSRAFGEVSNLQSIEIPQTVKFIANDAFYNCLKMVEVLLPKNLESIGSGVFSGCVSLEKMTIPNSVKEIGSDIFRDCTNLKSVTIPAGFVPMDSKHIFNGCSNLSTLNIDGKYTSIGDQFFYRAGLTSFDVPEGVISIGNGAFQNSKITSISIPNTVTSIDRQAFRNTQLTSITIPNSVTSLGGYALCDCGNLASVTLSSNLSTLEECLLVNACLKSLVIPSSVTTIKNRALDDTGLESLTIPSTITNIGGNNELSQLTSLIWDSPINCDNEYVIRIPSNCLVYVSTNAAMPPSWKNVIVKGTAESISLVEGVAYNCPKDFYAKKITFKKNFSMKTGNGEAAGWETIVLPFAATSIKNSSGGILAPFDSDVAGAKNFWLRELTTGGFKDVKAIEANKPYIIAMPNNSNYDSKYNITGDITFEAQNITVKATPNELKSVSGPSFSMSPVYKNLPRANQIYVINEEQEFEGAKPGSVFVRNLRDLKPFEAYITPNGVAPSSLRMIRIDGPVRTKSASDNSLKNKM